MFEYYIYFFVTIAVKSFLADLQGNIDEFSDLEFECSSQESLYTDTSDDEQPSIDLEQGKDNQADRVKFLAELFRKNFSAPKPKVKPVSRKEDGRF